MAKPRTKDRRMAKFINLMKVIQQKLFIRSSIANLMMLSFILFSAVGAGMIYFPAGFITAGVACAIFGLLLGSE